MDYDKDAENAEGLNELFNNPIYHSDFSSAIQENRSQNIELVSNNATVNGNTNDSKMSTNNFGTLVKTMNQGLGTNIEPDVPKDDIVQDIIHKYATGQVVNRHDPEKGITGSPDGKTNSNSGHGNKEKKKKIKNKSKESKESPQYKNINENMNHGGFDEEELMQL